MLLFPPFLQSVWGRVRGAVAQLDAFAETTHIFSAKITLN